MALTWETGAVAVIVATALVWAGRSIWRAGRKKQVCSTCGSAGTCPLVTGSRAMTGDGEGCGAVPDAGPAAAPPGDRRSP